MLSYPVARTEAPPRYSENRWTLQREGGDEWCSLACSSAGWTLSMHGGDFTVLAKSGDRGGLDRHAIDALRSRLRAQGWNETAPVSIRPKADRRRADG
jgi:hypothetical protein